MTDQAMRSLLDDCYNRFFRKWARLHGRMTEVLWDKLVQDAESLFARYPDDETAKAIILAFVDEIDRRERVQK